MAVGSCLILASVFWTSLRCLERHKAKRSDNGPFAAMKEKQGMNATTINATEKNDVSPKENTFPIGLATATFALG